MGIGMTVASAIRSMSELGATKLPLPDWLVEAEQAKTPPVE
jgi:hypothetical protein